MGSCEDYWYDLEHCFTDGTTMGIGGKVKDYCRCSCYNCGNDQYYITSFFHGVILIFDKLTYALISILDAPAPTTTTTPATTTMGK